MVKVTENKIKGVEDTLDESKESKEPESKTTPKLHQNYIKTIPKLQNYTRKTPELHQMYKSAPIYRKSAIFSRQRHILTQNWPKIVDES